MLKHIEKPDISQIVSTEKFGQLLASPTDDVRDIVRRSFSPYVHWTEIKYWTMPKEVSNLEMWALIKVLRTNILDRKESAVTDKKGKNFSWLTPQGVEEFLHQVDMKLGGNLFVFGGHVDDKFRHRLLTRGLMEEAIASSQLEGAHTTRKRAKEIILEKKKPRTKDEQMIVNNYEAMLKIEGELKDIPLSEDILFDVHRILTKNTDIEASSIGRYRNDTDDIVIGDTEGRDEIYHIPPNEDMFKKEIKRFLAYANDEQEDAFFVHPVIKAIILHFWLAYLHPFVDGNGRLARAIFYWYLLKHEYWAFGFLPLSGVIKASPAQYRDAYLYTEQDDNDLTYFIEYNIKKITQAIKEFEEYAERKRKESVVMSGIARDNHNINDRQIQLLRYFYKNQGATTSASMYKNIYNVSYVTAGKDLKELEHKGFLISKKKGRSINYYSTEKITELFNA